MVGQHVDVRGRSHDLTLQASRHRFEVQYSSTRPRVGRPWGPGREASV